MTIEQLIEKLKTFPKDAEVMILDSFNGAGTPREINLGPNKQRITKKMAADTADCEDRVGETVVVLGYGCY